MGSQSFCLADSLSFSLGALGGAGVRRVRGGARASAAGRVDGTRGGSAAADERRLAAVPRRAQDRGTTREEGTFRRYIFFKHQDFCLLRSVFISDDQSSVSISGDRDKALHLLTLSAAFRSVPIIEVFRSVAISEAFRSVAIAKHYNYRRSVQRFDQW